jgi:hypothetical protein
MNRLASDKFTRVCHGVWADRDTILSRRGGLSGEAALIRAVYWRLCKSWGGSFPSADGAGVGHMLLDYQRLVCLLLTKHVGAHYDGSPFLNELVRQYREEARRAAEGPREPKARQG